MPLAINRNDGAVVPKEDAYRVMVVDDSAVIRGLLSRWLETDDAIRIVASANNGIAALRQMDRADPEIVVLDIEMPEMDGITAVPHLLERNPALGIIMASTLTTRNAEVSLKALAAGASDYLTKPSSTRDGDSVQLFRDELITKIKVLGSARRSRQGVRPPQAIARPVATKTPERRANSAGSSPLALRRPGPLPRVLAIGSSTGGPQALLEVFGYLRDSVKLPILITQHMPETFTRILAEHIGRAAGVDCREAEDGEPLCNDRVYVAPGGYHMIVDGVLGNAVVRINQDPPENFCRPSVDPLFRSLARLFGANVLATILTGMGQDGLEGSRDLVDAGGTIVGQDEASSVVWGMPGAVAKAGLCSAVLPLTEIGPAVGRMVAGKCS